MAESTTDTPVAYVESDAQKVWKYSPDSEASVKVGVGFAGLQGGQDHCFYSDATLGNFIKGPVSLTAHPSNIRIHGFWTLNPKLLSCVPSSITTPNAVLVCDLPLSGAVELITEAVMLMAGVLV